MPSISALGAWTFGLLPRRPARGSFLQIAALAFFLAGGQPAQARTSRLFWIPSAEAPEPAACRFEAEDLFPVQRQSANPGVGQSTSYMIGSGCSVYSVGDVDVEAGLDWRESDDVRSADFMAPLQGFFKIAYGAQVARRDEKGWSVALGMDDIGTVAGQNDFNVGYFAFQNRSGPLELELGGFYGTDTLRTATGEVDKSGALLAARRYLGRGAIGLEWRSGRNRDGYAMLATRVQFDETLAATVGYGVANDRDHMRDWLLVRLTLSQ